MTSLVYVELLKLAKRPMTWVLLLLQLGILGLASFANTLSLRRIDPERHASLIRGLILPDSLAAASQIIYLFGAIMLGILTAAAVGSEYSWGTLRQLLATGLSRSRFLGAKLLALAIVAAAFVALSTLASVPMAIWVAQMEGLPLVPSSLDMAWLAALLGRTYLIVLMPMSLAFLIAVATRSQAVAVGVTLGVLIADQFASPILWSLGLDWSLALIDFFPFWCARSLLGFNFTSLPNELPNTMSQERALLTLSAYSVLCVVAGMLLFRRRDIGGPL